MYFTQKVYATVKKIPRGRVTTYANIARLAGKAHAARAVGNALNKNEFTDVPCHRVVRSDGAVGGYNQGARRKVSLLKQEGIKMLRDRVYLGRYLWKKTPFLK
ncbi:MAG: MGMT family protein [Candidatus Sungbacteria bacterium]|nr:MGMT family protein [Candidatus Sungbacteria bacterium]